MDFLLLKSRRRIYLQCSIHLLNAPFVVALFGAPLFKFLSPMYTLAYGLFTFPRYLSGILHPVNTSRCNNFVPTK